MAGLEQVYLEHRAALLRFLTARTGDPAEAEDIVQELWLRLQQADSGPIGNGRAYLHRMAQNLVLDRIRERRRRDARDNSWSDSAFGVAGGGELADTRPDAEAALTERQQTARLAAAIAQLPEAAGRAFRLHKIDGLSHAEIARRLGISRSGVEKHMAVAMAHLRRAMED